LFSQSDERGRCDLKFENTVPAVLWISHAGYVAHTIHNLRGGTLDVSKPIVLAKSSLMLSRVTQADGRPVASAEIRQCFSMWDKPVDATSPDAIAVRMFQRRYTTDPAGEASLAGLTGYHSLSALLHDQCSNPWTGIQPCEPVLVLRSTYTASGRVTAHSNGSTSHALDRITISATVDSVGEEIGYLTVRSDGTWGPAQLPVRPASEYAYDWESDVWMAEHVKRPAPAPGDVVYVDFVGEKGLELPVIVVDAADNPVEGARVQASSEYKGTTESVTLYTDAKGVVEFQTVRPGALWISAYKSGYEPNESERLELYQNSQIPYRIQLSPGGHLRGRVMLNGKPVRTFAIRVRNEAKHFDDDRHFLDRSDGTFEIPDLPLGDLVVVGSSSPTNRSSAITALINIGSTAEVLLQLVPGLVGNGHVLAAATGGPVPAAFVQPFLVVSGKNLGAFGPAHACNPDGSFEFAGFGLDRNVIEVTAPGFAKLRQVQDRDENGKLDFGWLVLQTSGGLTVQLNTDLPENIGIFAVGVVPGNLVPEVRMNTVGSARFEDIPPTHYNASIWMGAMRVIQTHLEVRPGQTRSWTIEHKRVRDLVAELDPGPGNPLPVGMSCRASYFDPTGLDVAFTAPFDDSGRVDFSRIPQDDILLDIFDADWNLVMSEWVHSDRNSPLVVKVPIGTPPVRVRVLDTDRKPIFPATVLFKQVRGGASFSLPLPTNAQGELEVPRIPEMRLTALVTSPTWRKWVQNLTPPAKPDDVLEIIASNSASIKIRALDRTTPLAALKLDLTDPLQLDVLFDSRGTSPEGLVHFDHLEQQKFDVRTVDLGYWPARVTVQATNGGTQADIQVRRLGGVRIHASIVGTPLRQKPIPLRSLEFDTDVSDWVTAGRVQASSGRLETNEDGELAVEGLPNGTYRWSVKNSSGDVVTGEFTVSPRSTSDVNIALP